VATAFDRVLREAIAAAAEGVAGGDLVRAAEALSRRYRDGEGRPHGPGRLTPIERLAYATVRLPATAAALDAVLGALSRHTGVAPATILDLGAGPATTLWPAVSRWPHLSRVTLVDRDPEMLRLGLEMWRHAHPLAGAGPEVVTRPGDLVSADDRADVVIAAYAIGELDDASAARAVDRALTQAARAVVLVEPGTPAGFARVRAARDRLLAQGAAIVAPCPHGGPCPMTAGDWCHFAVRLDRSRAHRQAKHGALGWEDEKFAYVIAAPASAGPARPAAARVVRRPVRGTGHVRLVLCTPAGLEQAVVTRRGDAYRAARDVAWGDAWPPERGAGE
jgi:ribosomal protein RSM22 (predicted rRNA methylase)